MDSILTSIKKLLGISEEDEHFDPDIIMHINSVFMILTQLGVGPAEGFRIEDEMSTWNDFTDNMHQVEAVKSYMYMKVKLLFDPPLNSSAVESMKNLIQELEFRLNLVADNTNSD